MYQRLKQHLEGVICILILTSAMLHADTKVEEKCVKNLQSNTDISVKKEMILFATLLPALKIATVADSKMAPAPASDIIASARAESITTQAKEYCNKINGTYVHSVDGRDCVVTVTTQNATHRCEKREINKLALAYDQLIDPQNEFKINIAGNVVSQLFLGLLLATYSYFKELQTSYGKCVVALSVVTILQQVAQIMSFTLKENKVACKITAISSHWLCLTMFGWMATIAYDLYFTFSRVRIPSPRLQKLRFRRYAIFSLLTPSLIVLASLVADISSDGQLIGYGKKNTCFISNYWGDIITFIIPVGLILVFNIICLAITLYYIRSAEKRSQALFSKDAKKSSKPSISFTIMAIKLAFLLGMSWVIGYIGGLSKNVFLLYCFVCLNSFQGVFYFFAFCCNKRVFAFYRRILKKGKKRIAASLTRMATQESRV